MATERIDIVVSERGARVVSRNIREIGDGAERSNKQLDVLKRALGAIASVASVAAIGRLADTFTTLQNRLRNVTTDTRQLGLVTNELFAISNRTRLGFESTAEVYARTALALKDVGISQQETLQFTESLNQAITLSGASANEANAALIQLSQGLASGTLRGDELRSVLEQLPAVADVIADGLGVTRGELRELGAQGKITSQDILEAFAEAREELAEKFARTVPTVGQAFVVLRNRALEVIGTFDQTNGITAALARTILVLADNFDTLARAAAAAALTIGTVFARRALGAALAGIQAIGVAVAANPLGALIIAVVAVTSALITFSDRITFGADNLINLRDVAGAVGANIIRSFTAVRDFLVTAFTPIIGAARTGFNAVVEFAANAANSVLTFVDRVLGFYIGLARAVRSVFANLGDAIREALIDSINSAIGSLQAAFPRLAEAIGVAQIDNIYEGAGQRLGEGVKEGLLSGFNETVVRDTLGAALDVVESTLSTIQGITEGTIESILIDAQGRAQARLAQIQAEAASGGSGLDVAGENRTLDPGVMAARTQLLRESVDARQAFADQLTAIQLLLSEVDSGFTQSDATLALANAFPELFANTPELIEAQVAQFKLMFQQIDALRKADVISEQTAQQAKLKVQAQISQQRLANTQQFFGTLSQLASSGNKRLAQIGKAAALVQATIDGVLGVQKALASAPPPVNFALAAAVGAVAAANVAQIAGQVIGSFQEGGFTGNVGRSEVAGLVHGQEFVLNAQATQRNRPVLEAMNAGATIGGTGVVININNETRGDVETTQTKDANGNEVIDVFIKRAADDVRQNGELGQAINQTFDINRQAFIR